MSLVFCQIDFFRHVFFDFMMKWLNHHWLVLCYCLKDERIRGCVFLKGFFYVLLWALCKDHFHGSNYTIFFFCSFLLTCLKEFLICFSFSYVWICGKRKWIRGNGFRYNTYCDGIRDFRLKFMICQSFLAIQAYHHHDLSQPLFWSQHLGTCNRAPNVQMSQNTL